MRICFTLTSIFCLLFSSAFCSLTTPKITTPLPAEEQNIFCIDEIPDWVTPHAIALEYIPPKLSEVNCQSLLIDIQENWQEKSEYIHEAFKFLTRTGVENGSKITITVDPSYQTACIHSIQIYRNGHWLDRLYSARCEQIQQEDPSGVMAFTGKISLVFFLNDIRSDDILEYSYTITGETPVLGSQYTSHIHLQHSYPIEQLSYSLLAPHDFSFFIKAFNTDLQPKIEEVAPSLKKWSWEVKNVKEYTREVDTPSWYDTSPSIQCSQYTSWEEAAKPESALYTLPDNFEDSIPEEMQNLVESWKNMTPDTKERALLACRFVQDKIRYLSFSNGASGWQPQDPCLTFNNRFGDCKGKSLLLHAFLRLMQIESKPLFVNTCEGKFVQEKLPSSYLFNHCVLQITIDNISYWIDPVIPFQGGSLDTIFFPDYTWGLLVFTDSEALVSIPPPCDKNPTEFHTSITVTSEDFAILKITKIAHGESADQERWKMDAIGLAEMSKNFLSQIQAVYGEATISSPLEYKDSLEDNIFRFQCSYQVPTEHLSDKKVLDVLHILIENYLDGNLNPVRTSPYALAPRVWIKEYIHIDNPFNEWVPAEETLHHEHPSIEFTQSMKRTEHSIDYETELHHLKDHVALEDLKSYWAITKDIKRHAPSSIKVTP